MADEARLNELLDLVEQARTEGDSDTEAKATAAYKRESAPPTVQQPNFYPPQAGMGMGMNNPFARMGQGLANAAPANIEDMQSPGKMLAAAPETALHLGSGAVATPLAGLAGIGQGITNKLGLTSTPAADRVRGVQDALTYQPKTLQGQTLTQGVTAPFAALQMAGRKAGETTTDVTGSPLAGAVADTAVNLVPALFGRGGRGPVRDAKYTRPEDVIPTKEALKKASGDAYKRSEEIGAVVHEGRFQTFQKELADSLEKDGIDKDLHPDASAALKRVMAEKGPMTLEKIETLRRIAQDAEGSIKPADARKSGEIVDAIDSMVEGLKPEDLAAGTPEAAASLKQARDLWKRGRKADVLDELMRRAELSAPNFSASGMENAIRTEFRALAKNERRFRRFSKEEQAAINRVAKGGAIENTLRFLGKAAPTGVVSTGLGTGLGFMLGGPAGAAAVPAIGAVARLGAKGLTSRNANLANELVRMGRKGDSFLSYASLDTSPAALGRGPNHAANAAAGARNPVESAARPGDPRAAASSPRSGVDTRRQGSQAKSLELQYLEALIEQMREGQ